MANLPESSTFDAGVYQLELTDPVVGGPSGVSNTPLKNLANRTKYLKDHVDALESSRAPLASPALTGTPTAPTAATGTNTTQLATTAFVNAEIANDAAPISHVGSTGTAHGVATTTVAGFMSAADKSKLDSHVGASGTAHAVATTSVAGFMSAADKSKLDGVAAGAQVNTVTSVAGRTSAIALAVADISGAAPLTSPAFSGAPTAPNPATGLRSAQLATMQKFADEFVGALQGNGYQRLPSGLIIQWGNAGYIPAGGSVLITFPIAFPNSIFLTVGGNAYAAAGDVVAASVGSQWISSAQFRIYNSGGQPQNGPNWIAIGY